MRFCIRRSVIELSRQVKKEIVKVLIDFGTTDNFITRDLTTLLKLIRVLHLKRS